MKPCVLEALGPTSLRSAEGELLQVGRLPLVLLTYLCTEGRPITRDHLGALFWPRSDRAHQLQNLRQAVLRLRKLAGADLLEGNGTLSVQPGSVRFDYEEFLSAIGEGRTEAALDLWCGPFLEGFRRPESWELEDWIDQQRSKLEGSLAAWVVEDARRLLEGEDPVLALALLRSARGFLPHHEEIGALLVMALALSGRRAEAEGVMQALEEYPSGRFADEMEAALEKSPAQPLPTSGVAGSSTKGKGGGTAVEELDGYSEADSRRWGTRSAGEDPDGDGDGPDGGEDPKARHVPVAQGAGGVHPASHGFRFGHFSLFAVAVLVLGLSSATVKDRFVGARALAEAQAGHALLVCASWATWGETVQLFRMGFDGKDKHRLAADRVCRTRWVDEAQAAFGVLEDPDGGQQLVRLTPNPTNPVAEWDISPVETAEPLRNPLVAPARPVVGPAGLLLFSAEDTVDNRDVYALETATGSLRRLTTSEGDDRQPSIDPEGRTVVFMSYRTGAGDLYRMNVDGSGLTRLTNHLLQDSRPWVRGDTVLFVRGRGEGDEDGNMELMLLDLRTGSETRLTENDWNDYDPRWSPDGTHICWLSEKVGHYESEVEVMELATGKRWNLSDSPGRDTLCRWTPDGRGIVYMAWRDGSESELFLKPFRGGRPMNLTRYPGEESMVDIMRLPDHFR